MSVLADGVVLFLDTVSDGIDALKGKLALMDFVRMPFCFFLPLQMTHHSGAIGLRAKP